MRPTLVERIEQIDSSFIKIGICVILMRIKKFLPIIFLSGNTKNMNLISRNYSKIIDGLNGFLKMLYPLYTHPVEQYAQKSAKPFISSNIA